MSQLLPEHPRTFRSGSQKAAIIAPQMHPRKPDLEPVGQLLPAFGDPMTVLATPSRIQCPSESTQPLDDLNDVRVPVSKKGDGDSCGGHQSRRYSRVKPMFVESLSSRTFYGSWVEIFRGYIIGGCSFWVEGGYRTVKY